MKQLLSLEAGKLSDYQQIPCFFMQRGRPLSISQAMAFDP
jgi:hypothetical protein